MGEAKRRERSEPNFGHVPKSANYRGLVVSPPIEIEDNRLFAKSSNLDPQELRFALLFWDRLVWPSSRAIHFASGPDEAFLESTGILNRPDYTFNGDAAQGIARGQIQAYQDLERTEPGVWALAQGENSFLLREGLADEGNGALIELHRAIPIPKHDVPLAEILEFKERRRDELILLRYQLESFVSDMESADDKTLALQKHIVELDKACSDLLAVGKEWQFPVYLSDIKVSFSLSLLKIVGAVATGSLLAAHGLPGATSIAASVGALSTVEIKGDIGFRKTKRPTSPFRYAYLIDRELR
jgi:hypothetical protein